MRVSLSRRLFFLETRKKSKSEDEVKKTNRQALSYLSLVSLSPPPSAPMADPHPATTQHRPPAAIELSNASTFVELLSALPPPVAPAPNGGVPRPPSVIGDAAAVERLSGDGAALARMRAALAGVRQVPYM